MTGKEKTNVRAIRQLDMAEALDVVRGALWGVIFSMAVGAMLWVAYASTKAMIPFLP